MRGSLVLAVANGLLLVAVAAAGSGCNNDCDFFERCRGDVREVCGDGPDQAFNRKIRREECEGPNTACVERDDSHAECVLPEKNRCDASFERRCEGELLVACSDVIGYSDPSNEPPRYEVGVACDETGGRCISTGDDANCLEAR